MLKRELKSRATRNPPLETIITWDNDYEGNGRGIIEVSFEMGRFRTLKTERGGIRYFYTLSTASNLLAECGVTTWRFTQG